jgi:hypothetical protein
MHEIQLIHRKTERLTGDDTDQDMHFPLFARPGVEIQHGINRVLVV